MAGGFLPAFGAGNVPGIGGILVMVVRTDEQLGQPTGFHHLVFSLISVICDHLGWRSHGRRTGLGGTLGRNSSL